MVMYGYSVQLYEKLLETHVNVRCFKRSWSCWVFNGAVWRSEEDKHLLQTREVQSYTIQEIDQETFWLWLLTNHALHCKNILVLQRQLWCPDIKVRRWAPIQVWKAECITAPMAPKNEIAANFSLCSFASSLPKFIILFTRYTNVW